MPSVLAAVDIASHGLVARRAQCVQSLLHGLYRVHQHAANKRTIVE